MAQHSELGAERPHVERILRCEREFVHHDLDRRIHRGQSIARRFQLPFADVGRVVDHLAVQVARIHGIEIDKTEGADSSRGEIHRRRCAQPSRADAKNSSRFQLALTIDANLRHDQVPAVALHLFTRQFGGVDGCARPAGNRGNNADRVAGAERRLLAVEVTDIFVVDINVDEAAKTAVFVVEMPSQVAVLPDEAL